MVGSGPPLIPMERDLQIWLIIVFLALLIAIQIFVIAFLIRVLNLLKPASGNGGLRDIAAKVVETMEALSRTTKTTNEFLTQIRPTVEQAVSISRRQLSHADQVVGEALKNVERMNQAVQEVAATVSVSFSEVLAISAGVRSATATFLGKASDSHKRKQW
jgi:signal transduction histidine kinase